MAARPFERVFFYPIRVYFQGMESEVTRTDPEWEAQERARREAEKAAQGSQQQEQGPHARAEKDEKYSLVEAADHDMVRRYKPKFMARGGEHIVYELPDRPNVVIKVDARVMQMVQEWNAEHSLPLDAMDPALLPYAEKYLREHRERQSRLSEYFGFEAVPRIHETIAKVPITGQITSELHAGKPPKGWESVGEAWTIVRVQKRLPELASPDRKTVVSGYTENGEPDPDVYARVTAGLLEGGKRDYTSEEVVSLFPEKMRDLLAALDDEPGLREAMADLVRRAAKYSKETKEILDLAGSDNIAVFKDGKRWKYRLVDALYPSGGADNMVGKVEAAARKAARGEPLSDYEKNVVLNGINYARAMNALAEKLGIEERVAVIPEDARGKVDYLAILKNKKG